MGYWAWFRDTEAPHLRQFRLVVALASDLGRSVTGQVVFGDNGAQLSRNRPAL